MDRARSHDARRGADDRRADAAASRLASWRYLLFSSVGLGLVLLGLICLTRSMELDHVTPTLFLDELSAAVAGPANAWRQLGVGLVMLGIGTKLGLAPMYSWLPEAYDEAPAAVTALLGAVQFNCALVLLFHVIHVFRPGSAPLITGELLTIGLASVAVSTVSIVATRNFKRLLAYASINHAGVIAIGLGLGKSASYGVLLYVRQQRVHQGDPVPHRGQDRGPLRHEGHQGDRGADQGSPVQRPVPDGRHVRAARVPAVRELPRRAVDPVGAGDERADVRVRRVLHADHDVVRGDRADDLSDDLGRGRSRRGRGRGRARSRRSTS